MRPVSTDSQDVDGNIVEERDFSGVTREDVEEEMRSLTGDIMQTPPMVSAVKKNGGRFTSWRGKVKPSNANQGLFMCITSVS